MNTQVIIALVVVKVIMTCIAIAVHIDKQWRKQA